MPTPVIALVGRLLIVFMGEWLRADRTDDARHLAAQLGPPARQAWT